MKKLVFAILSLAVSSMATAADQLPPLAKPGDDGYLKNEMIYPLDDKPTPQCHASTLAELPSGALVAAWFGGTHERNPDVGIWFSRQVDGRWTKPVELVDGSEGEKEDFPCWNPVLFQPKSGPLLLFYKVGPSPREWWGMLLTSKDGGQTWSKPTKLGANPQLGENANLIGPVKNKPIQLADGTILAPSSTEHNGWRVHFEKYALRNGQLQPTGVIGPIHSGEQFSAIQPSILTYKDGKMQILCRTRQKVVGTAWSSGDPSSWDTVSASELPNPNSGTDAVTLADGRQLIIYNHTTSGRNILNLAVSRDGVHWTPILTLENNPSKSEYSYPAIIQTSDGLVHISYTYLRQSVKHVVVDPAQLPKTK